MIKSVDINCLSVWEVWQKRKS